MKVLIVNALYPPYVRGGAEQSVQHLTHSLRQHGVDVVIAATAPRHDDRTMSVDGAKVHFIGMRNLYWPYDDRRRRAAARKLWHVVDLYNPLMAAALAKIIRHERPDVVHSNNLQGFSVAVWHAAAARRLPVVHTLRDYSLSCARACRFRNRSICATTCWDCRPFVALKRRASRWVDGVVGNSSDILERHRKLGFFASTGIGDVIGPSAGADLPASARDVGIAPIPHVESSLRFGYLGRLEPAKGVDRLLDVFANHAERCELHIAGIGAPSYEAFLRRYAAQRGATRVHWRGWIQATSFLREIDVLIVPSLWPEPMPRVILEAYAYGVPVIGACRGGIPEIVRHGESGLLFEPDDPPSLRAAVARLIDDSALRAALQRGARQQLLAHDPAVVAARYEAVYRQSIDAKRKRLSGA